MTKHFFLISLFSLLTGAIKTEAKTINRTTTEKTTVNNKSTITEDPLDSLYMHNPFFLDEVIIQGFKQDKNFRLSPQSTSSIDSKLLERQSIENIKEITGLVPNLYMPDYGSKLTSPIYIRGVGSKVNSPSVGLYIDGVPYFEKSAFDFNFSEIEQIDVLRGPQGTLYGRNTMGGIVNVYTKSPLKYQGTRFQFTGGNYNNYIANLSHHQRIKPNMGLSVSANYNHLGGYFTNVYTGKKADEQDAAAGRVRFDWNINPLWSMKITQSYDYLNQGGYPYGQYNPETDKTEKVKYNSPSGYKRHISTTGVNLGYTGNGFKVNSQTSFQFLSDHQQIDQDFTPESNFYVQQKEKQYMLSEEINIKSNNTSNYQWLFGLFGFWQKIDKSVDLDRLKTETRDAKTYDIPTYGIAVYHQSTLNNFIWDGLSLSAGIRFDYENATNEFDLHTIKESVSEKKDYFKHKLSFNQFTPKFTIQYTTESQQNIYATVTRGYKTGGFNTSFDTEKERTFKPEYSWNYELGTKITLFDHKLRGEFALFYIDWRSQQVNQPLATQIGQKLQNAGRSASKGVEASVTYRPINALTLQANYGYTKAYFKRYTRGELDFKDNRLPLVPDHTLSIRANYTFFNPFQGVDQINLGANYVGTGKIYWADTNDMNQSFHGLLNLNASIKRNNITLAFWTKNTTNTKYNAFCFKPGSSYYAQKGRPFTVGGTITITL